MPRSTAVRPPLASETALRREGWPSSLYLQRNTLDRFALRVLEVRPTVGEELILLAPVGERRTALEDLERHVRDFGVVTVGELAVGIVIGDADEILSARGHGTRELAPARARL